MKTRLILGSTVLMTLAMACGGQDPADGDVRSAPAGAGGSADESAGAAGSSGGPGTSSITGEGGKSSYLPGGPSGNGSACDRVRIVTSGAALNVRPEPSTSGTPVGTLPNGSIVDVTSKTSGESVNGNDTWYEIQTKEIQGYVSAAYATCVTSEQVKFYLPIRCGESASITQGNGGTKSHNPGKITEFAFDLGLPLDTPVVAMADGEVIHTYTQTVPGDRCYDANDDKTCYDSANLVVLRHADGTTTIYKHLNGVKVSVGDHVLQGKRIGRSGSTGYSTGPHLHFARQSDCGQANCQSMPMSFEDVAGGGVPEKGDTVTSGNCP
ncbi:MAG: peptidoglycan DD-metalloendopeptidase family protein [Polyangiaceae bacterium]